MNHQIQSLFRNGRRAIRWLGLPLLLGLALFLPVSTLLTQAQTQQRIYLPLVSGPKPTATPTTPTAKPTTPTAKPTTPVPTTPVPPAPASGGFFALEDYLSYNAATAIDAKGGVHMAFYISDERHEDDPPGQPALYTYCPGPVAACADPDKWSGLISFIGDVNEVQLAVTADGRPRLLLRRSGASGHYEYIYYACDQSCTTAAGWPQALLVTNAAGVEVSAASSPQHSFALDSLGRPRFIYGNGWGNGQPDGIYYAACDAAKCTEPGSWDIHRMLSGPGNQTLSSGYTSLVFDGTKPRAVIQRTLSGTADRTFYFACDASPCASEADWSIAHLAHPDGKTWANWDLALDASGRPRIALYEAAPVDIAVGGKLFYLWCDQNCGDLNSWQRTQVASGEGKNVDLAIAPKGQIHLVYDAGERAVLAELQCASNCQNAASWSRRVLQTSAKLEQEFPVDIPISCDQQGQWFDAIPSVAFDAHGNLVVAYDTKFVATCYTTTPGNPPQSRVERIWWGARWDYFD